MVAARRASAGARAKGAGAGAQKASAKGARGAKGAKGFGDVAVLAAKGAPARTRLLVDERRAQLIGLGLVFFTKQSYDAVSIDDVARAAGISKGLLYHYFPTKRDFYVATIREAARQLLERTKPDESLEPLVKLRVGLDTYLEYVSEHAAAYIALLRGGIGSDPEVGRIIEGARREFRERLIEGAPLAAVTPAVRVAMQGWVGFVEAATIDWLESGGIEREALRALLEETLLDVMQRALARG